MAEAPVTTRVSPAFGSMILFTPCHAVTPGMPTQPTRDREQRSLEELALCLQLRRRGLTTVVIGGIATNMGVESTARAAHEHGYAVVLAEDAATSLSAEMHAFAFDHIFPHLGRVAKADEIEL